MADIEEYSTEPNEAKAAALKELLLKMIESGDKTPIKMIQGISGNKKAAKVHFNFIPYSFEPEHQFNSEHEAIPAFFGSADPSSYRIELSSGKKESAISDDNPLEYQATVFINHVVDFELE